MDIAELLKKVVDAGASDLHMTTGIPPTMRLHGELRPMEGYPVIVPSTIDPIIDQITTPDQRERFERQGELDFSYGIAAWGASASTFSASGARRPSSCASSTWPFPPSPT